MSKVIEILYEDASFVVFNKPAGLLTIPSPKNEKDTLVDIANAQLSFSGDPAGKLHPCHRLDRETSGVIIFARGKKNQQLMMEQFQKGLVQKKYIAFVRGRIRDLAGEIKSAIRDYHQKKFQKGSAPRLAVTSYRTISAKKHFSVVEVLPRTGRTNQIRIQFSEIGHPLLGERVYAFRKDFTVDFRRLALHAGEITFPHPVKGGRITVRCPLPKDMDTFLKEYY